MLKNSKFEGPSFCNAERSRKSSPTKSWRACHKDSKTFGIIVVRGKSRNLYCSQVLINHTLRRECVSSSTWAILAKLSARKVRRGGAVGLQQTLHLCRHTAASWQIVELIRIGILLGYNTVASMMGAIPNSAASQVHADCQRVRTTGIPLITAPATCKECARLSWMEARELITSR